MTNIKDKLSSTSGPEDENKDLKAMSSPISNTYEPNEEESSCEREVSRLENGQEASTDLERDNSISTPVQKASAGNSSTTSAGAGLKAVLANLNSQRLKNQFTDVTIIVENETFHLHKNILAASSEYFQNLFTATSTIGDHNKNFVLLNITKNSFKILIDFIYTGGFELNKENVYDVYDASRVLKIGQVYGCCEGVIRQIDPKRLHGSRKRERGNETAQAPKPQPQPQPKPTTKVQKPAQTASPLDQTILANFLQNQTRHMSNATINANLLNNAIQNAAAANILSNLSVGVGPNILSSHTNSSPPTPIPVQSAVQAANEQTQRNLMSLQNSILPVEVQQVFLNQLASGKLNQNVSKSLRKDAAFLAKQLEKEVQAAKAPSPVTEPQQKRIKLEENQKSTNISLQDQLNQLARSLSETAPVKTENFDLAALIANTIGVEKNNEEEEERPMVIDED